VVFLAMRYPAFAEYPYSGYFGVSRTKTTSEDAKLICAIHFFLQYDDGRADEYVLDVQTFQKEKKVVFMRSGITNCTYVTSRKTEFCSTTELNASGETKYDFFNYIVNIDQIEVVSLMFNDSVSYNEFVLSESKEYKAEAFPNAIPFWDPKCPYHSETTLAPYLRDLNTMTQEETEKIQSVQADNFNGMRDTAAEVSKILSPTY
jgi:hypothetical protein